MSDAAAIVKSPERLILADGDAVALAAALKAAQPGELFVIPGAQARDKASFMSVAATSLALPSHFGRNWDAFADCIDELHWQDLPITIVVDDADQLLADEPAALDPLLRVLGDAFAPNPELPKSRLQVVLVGSANAPVVAQAQRLGVPLAHV
jgi:RNAse (barnase) inhibitor barstar